MKLKTLSIPQCSCHSFWSRPAASRATLQATPGEARAGRQRIPAALPSGETAAAVREAAALQPAGLEPAATTGPRPAAGWMRPPALLSRFVGQPMAFARARALPIAATSATSPIRGVVGGPPDNETGCNDSLWCGYDPVDGTERWEFSNSCVPIGWAGLSCFEPCPLGAGGAGGAGN